jgi:hypothetical protein
LAYETPGKPKTRVKQIIIPNAMNNTPCSFIVQSSSFDINIGRQNDGLPSWAKVCPELSAQTLF